MAFLSEVQHTEQLMDNLIKVDCPCCCGSGRRGTLMGEPMPCGACLGSGKLKNDPFWINYYSKVFGVPDGVQMSLNLGSGLKI